MELYFSFSSLVSALLFVLLGLLVFTLAFRAAAKSAIAAFREEIVDKQNMAAALLAGMIAISLSVIIAAAVH